jgi:hypothetical protein
MRRVTDPVYQILFLARFLCFLAVVYLTLHKIARRVSRKPDSKLLWFFSVLTAPLLRPVRAWTTPGTTEAQLLSRSLIFYLLLWLLLIAAGKWAGLPR